MQFRNFLFFLLAWEFHRNRRNNSILFRHDLSISVNIFKQHIQSIIFIALSSIIFSHIYTSVDICFGLVVEFIEQCSKGLLKYDQISLISFTVTVLPINYAR